MMGETDIGAEPLEGQIAGAAPDWLDDIGRLVWSDIGGDLRKRNFLRAGDEMAFARYCDHAARWLRLREKVNAANETYETESRHGKLQRINPDFKAMLYIEDKMVALEDRFGLSPAARYRILTLRSNTQGELPLTPNKPAEKADPKKGNVVSFPGIGAVGI